MTAGKQTLRDILLADPDVSSVSRRLVGQGAIEVGGVSIDDLGVLVEPPSGCVCISTRPPADAPTVRRWLRRKAGWASGDAKDWSDALRPENAQEITQPALGRVTFLMGKAVERGPFLGIDWRRARILEFVFEVSSPHHLHHQEATALISWMESEDHWRPNAASAEECRRLLGVVLEEVRQTAFDGGSAA
jgi:hypothetical protein